MQYFSLNPAFAPTVDGLFPTDGIGDFHQPVDPTLRNSNFSGLGLTGIRNLYGSSAGGTGFDLDWAVDQGGARVNLGAIQYIRIDVLSGASEIDGFSAVPEPRVWSLIAVAAGLLVMGRRRLYS
jgi:hypothetical protein